MKSSVEALEGNKVKLSVEVDEQEFEKAIDEAFRHISRDVRIPGFRPGKAPRKILEARIGSEAARKEALRLALPDYYNRAVDENEVDVIAAPEIDIRSGEDSGPVTFDAVVEVRPQIKLVGYQNVKVVIPRPDVTDEEVEAQIDRLRNQYGELRAVERPAQDRDHVTIDVKGTQEGEPVEGLTADDLLYEVGSETVIDELDAQLRGAKVGDILTFDAEVPDAGTVSFRVFVKDVKEKILPEPTDDWASDVSEFDTLEELRADIRKRIGEVKRVQGRLALRDGAVEEITQLVEEDPPDPLVDEEMKRRLQDLAMRLQAQGANLMQYLQATGQDQEAFTASLKESAARSVRGDLALRAIAQAESLQVDDDEITGEIARVAEQVGQKPEQVRKELERADQMPAVRSDLLKSKALEWLLEHVEVVDEEGRAIDRALISPEPAESVA